MAGLSEPVALAIIAGIVAVITAVIGAARTAAKPPTDPATKAAYTLNLDEDDRDQLARLTDAILAMVKALDEMRHEMMRRR